jgi:hypothetical protein
MKPDIKQKWVNDLKSGEYKKGKGYLHKEDTYCCLGVLCDLYQKETGQGAWTDAPNKHLQESGIKSFLTLSTEDG